MSPNVMAHAQIFLPSGVDLVPAAGAVPLLIIHLVSGTLTLRARGAPRSPCRLLSV